MKLTRRDLRLEDGATTLEYGVMMVIVAVAVVVAAIYLQMR